MYVAQRMGIEEDDRRFCEGTFISLSLYDPAAFAEKDGPEDGSKKTTAAGSKLKSFFHAVYCFKFKGVG
jgi:hypothetical protein